MDYSLIAVKRCRECYGTGHPDEDKKTVCGCVYRRMFRECLTHYHSCRSRQASLSSDVTEEIKHKLCSRPHEDYIIDFERVCEKALSTPAHIASFRCLLMEIAASSKRAAYGITSHEIISREAHIPMAAVPEFLVAMTTYLGRILHELKPYPLYPVKHYFGFPIKRKLFRTMPSRPANPLLDIKDRNIFLDAFMKNTGWSRRNIKRSHGISRQGRLHRSFMNMKGYY